MEFDIVFGISPLVIVRFTKIKKWPVAVYGHTALKGLTEEDVNKGKYSGR